MKALIISISMLFTFQVNAQSSFLNFKEENILINGVSTNVENSNLKGDLKQIKKSWLSFAKEHLQQKMSEKNDVLYANEIVINQVTDKRGDLIVYLYNKDNEVAFNMAFRVGYDVYLNSSQFPEEFSRLKNYLKFFIYDYYKDYLPVYIEGKNNDLKVLVKEKDKAEKDNRSLSKENKKITGKIEKNSRKTAAFTQKVQETEDGSKASDQIKRNLSELTSVNSEFQKQIEHNSGRIKANEEIISSLNEKINATTKDIDSAKLSLIEIRSKS